MRLCDFNCVILWTNRARCALNREILNLLNEESVSGESSGRASLYKFDEKSYHEGESIAKDTIHFFSPQTYMLHILETVVRLSLCIYVPCFLWILSNSMLSVDFAQYLDCVTQFSTYLTRELPRKS